MSCADGPDGNPNPEEAARKAAIESIANDMTELFKDDKYADERESVTKTVQDLFLQPTEVNMQYTLDLIFGKCDERQFVVEGAILCAKMVSKLPQMMSCVLEVFNQKELTLTPDDLDNYSDGTAV